MRRATVLALLTAVSLLAAGAAQAAIIHFQVTLSGANENPANNSAGTGFAKIDIDPEGRFMYIDVTFSGLSGPTTASHIHCCAAPTANAPVATQVPTFVNFPLGVTSGSYTNAFDMALASSYNPTFVTAHGGSAISAFDFLLAGMLDGQTYLNIHTQSFGGGEIRGTLIQVPEPGSVALLGIALAGLGALRRRAGRA